MHEALAPAEGGCLVAGCWNMVAWGNGGGAHATRWKHKSGGSIFDLPERKRRNKVRMADFSWGQKAQRGMKGGTYHLLLSTPICQD